MHLFSPINLCTLQCDRRKLRVVIVDMLDRTMLVSFAAQTCAIPPCMYKSAYRIFICLSTKVLICIVTVVWMAWTNCFVLSLLLLSKLSGSAALALHDKWLPVSRFMRIVCATEHMALVATLDTSLWVSISQSSRALLAIWSCAMSWEWS